MYHAPSVVIVSWQRSEYGNICIRYESCSISCHRLLTTVRAWLYIPKVWIMFRQLSSSHDNGQRMVKYPSSMTHSLSVVIVIRQRVEHGNVFLRYETCSVSCHRLMTMVRAWYLLPPSVFIVSWQGTDHGYSSLIYATCSASCHRPMTTVRAWWLPLKDQTCSVSCHRLMITVRAW